MVGSALCSGRFTLLAGEKLCYGGGGGSPQSGLYEANKKIMPPLRNENWTVQHLTDGHLDVHESYLIYTEPSRTMYTKVTLRRTRKKILRLFSYTGQWLSTFTCKKIQWWWWWKKYIVGQCSECCCDTSTLKWTHNYVPTPLSALSLPPSPALLLRSLTLTATPTLKPVTNILAHAV